MSSKNGVVKKAEPIEKRLFSVSLLVTVCLMGIYTGYGFFIGYGWPVKLIYLSGFIVYGTIFVLFKCGFSFRILSLTYYYLIVGMLIISWSPSGGLLGAIIRFVVLTYMSGLMVLHLRDFLGFCIIVLLVVCGFSYLEYTGLIVAAPYTDRKMWLLDLLITNTTMLLVIGVAIYYFKKAYLEDRLKLHEANADLKEEKVKAQSADKAKTEFLATISHEMRTPLNGIVGITDLLNETSLNPTQQELIDKLAYSSNLLNNLISDVLDLSLIESGKLAFKEESFVLKEELKGIFDLVRPRLVQKKDQVDLHLQMNAEVGVRLISDVKRFRQILINLLVNAIKYTEKGLVTLHVDLDQKAHEGMQLKFSIVDTGVGIAEDRQKLLFSKFYKAHEHSTIEGTGLGLSIAKRLVEGMGGTIGFTSTLGVGSMFYFCIPFKIDRTKEMRQSTSEPIPIKDYSQLSILVAEDQEINVMIIQKMLENMGVTDLDYARDGNEVILKVEKRMYDVILMDVQMPNKDGIEAARELSTSLNDQLPIIIALTANVLKEDIDACMDAGMHDFISKPFKKEHLIEVFDRHLGGKKTVAES